MSHRLHHEMRRRVPAYGQSISFSQLHTLVPPPPRSSHRYSHYFLPYLSRASSPEVLFFPSQVRSICFPRAHVPYCPLFQQLKTDTAAHGDTTQRPRSKNPKNDPPNPPPNLSPQASLQFSFLDQLGARPLLLSQPPHPDTLTLAALVFCRFTIRFPSAST